MKLKHFILTCCTCCGLFAAEEPLSLSIFKEISAAQKSNVLYSPNIMETSLAYVAQCTIGKTKDELRNLRYSAPDKYSAVNPLSAAALFVADDVKLKEKKLSIMRVPFATDPAAAVKKINAWFSRKTHHLIPNAIGADAVNAGTRLFFASALSMKEGWVETFDKEATVPNYPFTRSDDTVVKVPMMVAKDSTLHHYAEGEDWQAVRLVIMSVMWGGALGAYDGMAVHHFSITLDKPFIFIIGAAHPQVVPYFMGICENPAEAPGGIGR